VFEIIKMVDILETDDEYICGDCRIAYGLKLNAEECCSTKPKIVGGKTDEGCV